MLSFIIPVHFINPFAFLKISCGLIPTSVIPALLSDKTSLFTTTRVLWFYIKVNINRSSNSQTLGDMFIHYRKITRMEREREREYRDWGKSV